MLRKIFYKSLGVMFIALGLFIALCALAVYKTEKSVFIFLCFSFIFFICLGYKLWNTDNYKNKKEVIKQAEQELRLKELKIKQNEILQNSTQSLDISKTITNSNNSNTINFPENWYISLSFGKSKSENFPQAVGLAKSAPKYIENNINGQIIYQAIYSANPNEYLLFIKLYELVSNWKSCYVVINGEFVDRKIVQGLNYCYGDRCRTGKPDFCYGASYMTENIFGCHRLQISACNHPLYLFYKSIGNTYILDEQALLERITRYSQYYKFCPCFNEKNIYDVFNKLPRKINRNQYKKLLV